MKKPNVICPACKEVYYKSTKDEYVVICGIIYEQYEVGMSNFPNYTIVPSHCEDDKYTKCQVWRGAKDAEWAKQAGKYSSLDQMEKIRI
jgi:hypothetical protein